MTARCVCVLSGRLLSGDPDPTGQKVEILRRALAVKLYIKGFFLECAARAPAMRYSTSSQPSPRSPPGC